MLCLSFYLPVSRLLRHHCVIQTVCDVVCTGMHCTECGYNCHEKCVQHVPKNCTKIRPLTSLAAAASNIQPATTATDSTLVASATLSAKSTARGMWHYYTPLYLLFPIHPAWHSSSALFHLFCECNSHWFPVS